MVRVIVILLGGLVGLSAYQTAPDVNTAMDAVQNSPMVGRVQAFTTNWTFIIGFVTGLAANEALRWTWRTTTAATQVVTSFSGQMMHYAAVASIIGLVLYFI